MAARAKRARVLSAGMSHLGLLFHFDTNFVDDTSAAAAELRRLDADGWVTLQRADTVDTELDRHRDEERREQLLDESGGYPESLGPLVWNESRWDHSVFGSDDDAARLAQVFNLLFPGTDWSSTSRAAGNKRRDAMHVATALRYGIGVFITRDQGLLSKSGVIAAAFNDFKIMTPEEALAFALRMKARYEYRESHPLPHAARQFGQSLNPPQGTSTTRQPVTS
jgi:hypothetical protein